MMTDIIILALLNVGFIFVAVVAPNNMPLWWRLLLPVLIVLTTWLLVRSVRWWVR